MNNRSQVNANLTGLAFLAFVFAIVFMVGHTREIMNIIASFVQYEQHSYFNISNFAYCLVGIIHMLISVAIMYPHKNMLDKKDMLKVLCYSLMLVYLAANIWVFEWFVKNLISGKWSFDVAQFLKQENMMFNHMQWGSRNAETLLYNHISAVVWLGIGYYFDRDRKITCKLLVVQMLVAYGVPMLGYFIYRGKMIPDWWIKKTIPLICSDIILTLALMYGARSRASWEKYVCPLIKKRRRRHHHHDQSAVPAEEQIKG